MTIKKWKTIPWPKKIVSNLLINPLGCFLAPWDRKDLNKEKKGVKKFEKNCTFCQKNAEIRDVKMLKPFHYR